MSSAAVVIGTLKVKVIPVSVTSFLDVSGVKVGLHGIARHTIYVTV